METFLIEVYESRGDRIALDELALRCRGAVQADPRGQTGLRYIRSILVPDDETCFHLFEAASAEDVRTVCLEAGLTPLRVVGCLAPADG